MNISPFELSPVCSIVGLVVNAQHLASKWRLSWLNCTVSSELLSALLLGLLDFERGLRRLPLSHCLEQGRLEFRMPGAQIDEFT